MVPEAVVVLKVVVGVVFSDPRFQDEPFVIAGVAGGEAMESFGDLMVDQPIQLNPGGIGFRTFLKMKVGMVCGFIAGIVGVLRIQENWCFLVEPDDSWSFWWIWEFLGFGLEVMKGCHWILPNQCGWKTSWNWYWTIAWWILVGS